MVQPQNQTCGGFLALILKATETDVVARHAYAGGEGPSVQTELGNESITSEAAATIAGIA
jgi:hypothetical protein